MNYKIKSKIKKISIYCLFAIFCMFFYNINASAYTGSDIVNITTSSNWANYYNFKFNDNVDISQTIINNQIAYMQAQINADKATLGATYYLISNIQLQAGYGAYYQIYYYSSSPDLDNKMSSNFYMYENDTQNSSRMDFSTTIKGSREFIFSNSTTDNVSINSLSTGTSGYIANVLYGVAKDRLNIYMPKTYFVSTDIPKNLISNWSMLVTNYGGYPTIKINDVQLTKGNVYKVTDYFDFVSIEDNDAPILDFTGISTPFELWQGDTFVAPMPIATDNIDGDITNQIQVTSSVNPSVVGNYNITYEVCDDHNNCTTALIQVIVKNPWKEIDMTGKGAILFYYKDYSLVKTPNAYCSSIDLNGACFVQDFQYLGRWKYSKALLNNLNVLTYQDGGVWVPLDPAQTDYKNYNHINIGHTTDDFTSSMNYGVFMYNESGANSIKIKYNQKWFNYKIYNSLNDTDTKDISYVDSDGNNQDTTDTSPPFTELDDPAQQGTIDLSGIFGSFNTNTYGLTAVISAPLSFINRITSSTCVPVVLPFPYIGNVTLPCMTSVYRDTLGQAFDTYQLIAFGVVAYWVIVKLLNMIKDFKNPDHDEIEVLDL